MEQIGLAMTSKAVTLDDKYRKERGHVFLNGMQSLVRLPLVQRRRDKAAGLNTAGFISGYRGSPLGGYDQELQRAQAYLESHDIRFEPAINEDLAATAIWGTQQLGFTRHATKDGVFGIWYGKGPGVDRSMDVLRHGNAAGSAPLGGVLCIAGDDHGAKSSTLPHQTDHNFMTAFMPLLYPSGIHEIVEYGLLGIAMSRYSGCWVGLKVTSETIESSGTVDLDREWRDIVLPTDFDMPEGGLNIRWPDRPRDVDTRLQRYKGFAALAFARANGIDHVVWDSPNPRFGIMTSGKSYQDVRQALYQLGIDEKRAADIGLRLYKVGMPWPLEPEGARQFCEGLGEVLVVEEKREMIEHQLKWQLFNWREEVRPTIVGKHDEDENWLLPPENELTVGLIAHVIAKRLARLYDSPEIRQKLEFFRARKKKRETFEACVVRSPYFCSGCPHNTSTKVPDGSRALAGIGCHYMVLEMDRHTETFTQMGGEGVPWIGQAPFTDEKHVFVNLGDGTFQHSGLLAIRAAVAANVNITYKILFNDAVAMTGGQAVDGDLTVQQIARQIRAQGVERIAILSELPKYLKATDFPKGVEILDRKYLDHVQREFRETEGCTAIIFDQTCAAEKRRRRKRGQLDDPPKRAFINPEVCEGCGDCSDQSNCVSVEPLETELGRKRVINQSTCNKDFSCVEGFCPSFVTVYGGSIRRSHVVINQDDHGWNVPLPRPVAMDEDYNILVTGIGGTGVLTVGGILGMAAHLEGKQALISDMTGLAQKGGAVLSHVRLARDRDWLRSSRIITGGAHVLLACDSVVAASVDAIDILHAEHTKAVVNTHLSPVAEFVRDRDFDFHEHKVLKDIKDNTIAGDTYLVPASELATALMGDSIMTNLFMVGYAFQKGLIPLSRDSIHQAIRLNGTAVEANIEVFEWGRRTAHDETRVRALVEPIAETAEPRSETLEDLIAHRMDILTQYQNAALAARYHGLIERVVEAESKVNRSSRRLSEAVARMYAKLLAYKDEYEVARLYTDGTFRTRIERQFEGSYTLKVHLSPPLFNPIDRKTGRPRKIEFGSWIFFVFRLLARLKGLRGTFFDVFGWRHERRVERQLIRDYEADIERIMNGLHSDNLETAAAIANLPEDIRGFGHIKARNIEAARAEAPALWARFDATGAKPRGQERAA
ncbi:MAG: indolepyruvate ferredoxin oxidoreductase family protein [Alphaproteobacteria bacterium]|nr:MAG: indolepyruvate ferredoxin oxidoreductase family protein [Alphaproteobacteria bacterium]